MRGHRQLRRPLCRAGDAPCPGPPRSDLRRRSRRASFVQGNGRGRHSTGPLGRRSATRLHGPPSSREAAGDGRGAARPREGQPDDASRPQPQAYPRPQARQGVGYRTSPPSRRGDREVSGWRSAIGRPSSGREVMKVPNAKTCRTCNTEAYGSRFAGSAGFARGCLSQVPALRLDLDRLEKPHVRSGKLIARCPACAETGADRSCEHLVIVEEGRGPFGCVMNQGPDGHEHRRRIFELVGESKARLPRTLTTPKARYIPAKGKPRLPDLRPLSIGEMAAIAESRAWCSFAGLELLTRRRLLWHGMVWDDGREWPAWIITDSTRFNAQARRLDGEVWHGIGDKKAKTLPGCDPSWPD